MQGSGPVPWGSVNRYSDKDFVATFHCVFCLCSARTAKMAARVIDPIDPLDVAAKLFKDQPKGFPFEGFDIEELILPEGEDFGIRSDDDDIEEDDLEAETGFGSVIGMLQVRVVRRCTWAKRSSCLQVQVSEAASGLTAATAAVPAWPMCCVYSCGWPASCSRGKA